ncbi:energy transducer TonB [Shewanella amazonensis]|uniref:TonB domain protein n=1 Tax=Shewanella amazonensis (strain ATCC BAA-1098 / SB2B) TaxID=326297 RepID=A1S8E2_SHEAM|nr:energy transducer TonB [Shewanella amazonensis]ABM00649.1 TonB domain protein [Shewanella amazonensis SB2B]
MKTIGKIAPLLLALSTVSPLVLADEFSDVYRSYQQAWESGNNIEARGFAEKAYSLGEAKFGKDSVDYANLGLNLAKALRSDNSGDFAVNRQRATEIATLSLASYEARFGEEATDLIDPLMVLGDVTQDSKTARKAYQRALNIAKDSGKGDLLAYTRMNAFKRLARTEYYTSAVYGYIRDAHEYFAQHRPANSAVRLEATYLLAGAHMGNAKYRKAEPLYLEVIEQYKVLDYTHPYALGAHSRLVELYERMGKSELSTEHCIAIGSMKPWDDNQEQTPLFRKNPEFPMELVRRGKSGWAEISFTVDEMGMVRDPKVLDSEGGKGFEKASMEALSAWRYAPKFEDGKPVKAESSVRLDFRVER